MKESPGKRQPPTKGGCARNVHEHSADFQTEAGDE